MKAYNARMQSDLFFSSDIVKLDMPCADVDLYSSWLENKRATDIFNTLAEELAWEQPEIIVAGKKFLIPRLQVWCGDPGAVMRYSGMQFTPQAWHKLVLQLKEELEDLCTCKFNSALINLYRNGQDSVSWHADDEVELGPQPTIASLSLGATRTFKFKSRKKTKLTLEEKPRQLVLNNGDLVVMKSDTQKHWLHCVPKCDISTPRRMNLTFRRIAVMS